MYCTVKLPAVLLVENTDQKWENTDQIQTTFSPKYRLNTDHFLQKYRPKSNFPTSYRLGSIYRNHRHSLHGYYFYGCMHLKYILRQEHWPTEMIRHFELDYTGNRGKIPAKYRKIHRKILEKRGKIIWKLFFIF